MVLLFFRRVRVHTALQATRYAVLRCVFSVSSSTMLLQWRAIGREVPARGFGAACTMFDLKWLLSQTQLWVGKLYWSYCASRIRCYMGRREHAYVHSKAGLECAQYSHPPLPEKCGRRTK